ncbi:MAG: gspE, partial [Candidatus Berkelbacteria bacterium]|nr:gspE [Candidatus Berkelbacteria bacterium]
MPDIDMTLQHMARDDEERHAKEAAKKLSLPYINLVSYPFAPDVMAIIPEEMALTHSVVAYLKAENVVRVASNNPQNTNLKKFLDDLKVATKNDYPISYCSDTSINYALTMYKMLVPKVQEGKVEVTEEKEQSFEKEIKTLSDLKEKITKVSTTELLDVVFAGAIKLDATDIHIEPGEQTFRIRYRIDGVLQDVTELPQAAFHAILSRIKYLAKLKLDVTHPQDGRFEIKVLEQDVDIRVATLPTSYGEAVGLRLLP